MWTESNKMHQGSPSSEHITLSCERCHRKVKEFREEMEGGRGGMDSECADEEHALWGVEKGRKRVDA